MLYIGSKADIGYISDNNRFWIWVLVKDWYHFFFNLLNEVSHHQRTGSVEKNVSLKVTLTLTKLLLSCWFLHLQGHIDYFDYTVLYIATAFFTIFLLPKVSSQWTRHQMKLVFLASTTQIPSTRYLSNIFVPLSASWFTNILCAVRSWINL